MHEALYRPWRACGTTASFALAASAAAAGCFHPSYEHVMCGPGDACPAGTHCRADQVCVALGDDGGLPIPDGGIAEMRSFGPSELAAGQLIDMTFDAVRGALTPSAYSYGGLIAHGLAGQQLWDAGQTTWRSPASANATVAGLWRGDGLASGNDVLHIAGSSDTTTTVWFEGEVWLDAASTEQFGLAADAVAFVDLARPGTASFSRVVTSSNAASPTTASVATPVTGWYPIRIGFANDDAVLGFAFTHSDTAAGAQIAWTRERLRARASELGGALRTVFAHQILGGGDVNKLPISHVDDGTLIQTAFVAPPPGASSGNVNWSARYAGQVYAPQTDSYTLTVRSDDGHELWFGGQTRSASWAFNSGTADASSTVTATLNAGWNDVIIDYNQVSGGRVLQVQLTGGGLDAAEIPHAQLRPVEPALDRLAFGADDASHVIRDNGGAGMPGTAVMAVDAHAGGAQETVTAIDVTYEVVTPRFSEIRIDLESPTQRVAIAAGGGLASGDVIGQTSIGAGADGPLGSLLGGPASGTWKLHVYDVLRSGPGNLDSTLKSARLTLHTTGGPDKIARTASWTSQVIDATSNAIAIDDVTWKARVPDGAGVQVRLRGCQQNDCSDGPAWSAPVTSGVAFAIIPARYLQLRVELTSDGSHEPELQSLAMRFRRAG